MRQRKNKILKLLQKVHETNELLNNHKTKLIPFKDESIINEVTQKYYSDDSNIKIIYGTEDIKALGAIFHRDKNGEYDTTINSILSVYQKFAHDFPGKNADVFFDKNEKESAYKVILSKDIESLNGDSGYVGSVVYGNDESFCEASSAFTRYGNVARPLCYLKIAGTFAVGADIDEIELFTCQSDKTLQERFVKNIENGVFGDSFAKALHDKLIIAQIIFQLFVVSYENEKYWKKETLEDGTIVYRCIAGKASKEIDKFTIQKLMSEFGANTGTLTRILVEEYLNSSGNCDTTELARLAVARYQTDELPITSEERKKVIESLTKNFLTPKTEEPDEPIEELIEEKSDEEPKEESNDLDDFFSALGRKI